jgi:uncharacterized surface protein with fasciclin (FAS1) repeats
MDTATSRNPLLLESQTTGQKSSFTFLVPTDDAFRKIRSQKIISSLDTQPQYVEEVSMRGGKSGGVLGDI